MVGTTKIWLTGGNGQLARAILKECKNQPEKYTILTTDKDVDITDMEEISKYAITTRPDIIINCAGITDIAACEQDVVMAYKVNALGARNMSAAARMVDAKIIHISTDDVFSGDRKEALMEFDTAVPTSVYGKSKLAGEMLVRELNPKHLVIRSSWAYGDGDNYVSRLLERIHAGETVEAANDQISTPTSMDTLAKCILVLMGSKEYGICHVSCEGACSRYEFAKKILELTGDDTTMIKPILSENISDGWQRPKYSVLENLMLKMTELYQMPRWEDDLEQYLESRGMKHE